VTLRCVASTPEIRTVTEESSSKKWTAADAGALGGVE